jgi:DNA repair exonuclease SbcCD ATPase subunit
MRLERLHIGGFGCLPGGRELNFAPGMNLVLAPNERGKTTLGELIAGLFYGFGRRSGGVHPFEPWSGGSTGGELAYCLANGQSYTLGRHLDKREQVVLRDAAGREVPLNGRQPGELHLGLGQGAFLTVSRIRLDDLQQALYAEASGKELTATRQWLAGYFFSEAATRGEVSNPVAVLQEWTARRERLYSDDRRKGAESKRLRQEEAEAREALAQARQREEQALQTKKRLEELAGEAASLDQRRRAAGEEAAQAAKRLELAGAMARRKALCNEIAELEKLGLAPAEAETRARELGNQTLAAAQRAQKAAQEAEQAKDRARQLAPDGDPEALEKRLQDLTARRAELNAAHRLQESEESRLSRRAGALAGQWGGLEPAALAGLDSQLPHRVERLRGRAAEAQRRARQARDALAALPAPPAAPVWWLGLAIIALVGGLKLVAWAVFTLMPPWTQVLGWALILGGAGLGLGWVMRRRGKKKAALAQSQAQAAADQAGQEEAEAQRELDAALEELPPALRQTETGALSLALAEAARLEQDRAAQDQERTRLEEQRAQLLADTAELAPTDQGGMETALEQLRGQVEQAKQALAEARRLADQARRESEQAARLERELAGHLAALGLEDLEALAAARQRHGRVRDLKAAGAELDQGLGPAAGQPVPDEEEVRRTLDAAQAKAAALDREMKELSIERGSLAKELEHLTRAESVAQAEARLARLNQERAALARRHDTLLLAEALLARAMEEFRLEAQPGLLKKAGRYLRMATAGAYEWLGTDLFAARAKRKGEPEIKARRGPGSPERDSEALSRGARDQLYLCLRLALAEEITTQAEPLPLILDDPLVNFDDARLAATLEMLCAVAAERQVLFLTCHQHQAELLAQCCQVKRLEI